MKLYYLIIFILFPSLCVGQFIGGAGHLNGMYATKIVSEVPDSTIIPFTIYQPGGIPIRVPYAFSSWITSADHGDSVKLGILPANCLVMEVKLWVEENFNAIGDDIIKVGHSGNKDAYIIETDVSAKGIKTNGNVADGVRIGKTENVVRQIYAYYTVTESIPTTGKALVTIIWTQVDAEP